PRGVDVGSGFQIIVEAATEHGVTGGTDEATRGGVRLDEGPVVVDHEDRVEGGPEQRFEPVLCGRHRGAQGMISAPIQTKPAGAKASRSDNARLIFTLRLVSLCTLGIVGLTVRIDNAQRRRRSPMALIKVSDLAYGRLRAPDLDQMEEFLTHFG